MTDKLWFYAKGELFLVTAVCERLHAAHKRHGFMNDLFKQTALGMAVFMGLACSAHANNSPIAVDLQADGTEVTFTLTNAGGQPITVLLWDTPLEAVLSSDIFTFGEDEVGFKGRHIKRATPLERDFLDLSPGQAVSASLALNRYYDIVDHANYQVTFNGPISYSSAAAKRTDLAAARAAMQSVELTTESVEVDLAPAPPVARALPAGYLNCTVDQQAQISTALDASEQLTIEARDALINLPVSERATSPRYTRWFGSYTEARYAAVQGGMSNAASVMANQVIDFNCDCDEGAFAYVFTNDPFKIYLCRAFWTASVTGTDSQAGTILHELSHFPEVKGTDDHAYGQTAAAALARTDPARASNNADSFEYFVENTPALAMRGDGSDGGEVPVDSYLTLTPGTSLSGSVAENDYVLYQSNGASEINLTTTSGDADLYIFGDEARTELLCDSFTTTELDACNLGSEQNLYIQVDGYLTSTYTIAAIGTPVVNPQTDGDGGGTDGGNDGTTDGGGNGTTDAGNGGTSGGGGGGAVWFGMLALLFARQTRSRQSGYGAKQ